MNDNPLPDAIAKLADEVGVAMRQRRRVPRIDLMRLKTQLKAHAGLQDGFRLFRWAGGLSSEVEAVKQKTVFQLDRARSEAVAMHVVHPGGETCILNPPRTIGSGSETKVLRGPSRAMFFACFAKATAYGRTSTIRLSDGTFAFDLQKGELEAVPVDMAFDPVVFDQTGDDVICIDDRRSGTRIAIPEAFSLLGVDTEAFGHWMSEEFLKFLAARSIDDVKDLPILIDADIPEQHKQSLVAYLGPDHPIIEIPQFMRVECGRLWVASTWLYSPKLPANDRGIDPNILAYPTRHVAKLVRQAAEDFDARHGEAEPSGPLYLTRDQSRHRGLTNAYEVSDLVSAQGYRPLRPETLSFVEQIKLYRACDRIVAQAGSAMIPLMYCRPGAKICILSHGLQPFGAIYFQLMADIGLDLTVVVGETKERHPDYRDRSTYEIGADDLSLVLNEMRKGASP